MNNEKTMFLIIKLNRSGKRTRRKCIDLIQLMLDISVTNIALILMISIELLSIRPSHCKNQRTMWWRIKASMPFILVEHPCNEYHINFHFSWTSVCNKSFICNTFVFDLPKVMNKSYLFAISIIYLYLHSWTWNIIQIFAHWFCEN